MYFVVEEKTMFNGSIARYVHGVHTDERLAIHWLHVSQLALILATMERRSFSIVLHAAEEDAHEFYGEDCVARCRAMSFDSIISAIESKPTWQRTASFNDVLAFDYGRDVNAIEMQGRARALLSRARDWKSMQKTNCSTPDLFSLTQSGFEAHLSEIFAATALEL